jgi:glycosyltransferase involved in cell wall biosynthesis
MNPNPQTGLASIIIPCWNQLEFTRQCIAALRRYTRPPWEMLLIDNGSTDGTRDYLAGVQDAAAVPVTVIANATNLGFPAAINQGLKFARGEYLVLLNNDVVVTEGWLDQLVALANISPGGESAEPEGRRDDWGLGERENVTVVDFNEIMGATNRADATPPSAPCGAAGGEPPIGLVGPMSNYAAPPQLVENVPYADLNEMHAFARRWREEHRGQWFTAPKLSGFCLLVKRAVHEAVGGLDERFGLGLFDDDDLAERARRAGFQLAVAHDLFVHHFGSRSFIGNQIDTERLLDENARQFAAKWGHAEPAGRRVALAPWAPAPRGNAHRETALQTVLPAHPHTLQRASNKDRGPRPTTSLTIIARNEEKNLPSCLESIKGVFDEIVVVDTGSTDRTVEIARSFGARLFDFIWVDDFAAARNAALARATGAYAFWLDADDVVDPHEREKLQSLLGSLRAGDQTAYVVRCACDPGEDGSGGNTVVDHVRLFPVREDVRWTYRVHEQILPALKRLGIPVRWSDVTVRHTGYKDAALRARKLDRDRKILREQFAERPDDPFTLFNLGADAIERNEGREALAYLRRSLSLSAPTDSITRKLYALISRAHQMLAEPNQAIAACGAGLEINPDDAELLFREAIVRRHCGDNEGAGRCWSRILTLKRPEQFSSVDQGIYGHLTRSNLAVLAAERGDLAEAERLLTEVLAECPGDAQALSRLESVRTKAQKPGETPGEPAGSPWIVPGSRRCEFPANGPGDFDPYVGMAAAWVKALNAKVVVELGVRFGDSTRALLVGAREVDGHVWGVDALERHGVDDPRFTFIPSDPLEVAGRWNQIDLLHVDIDAHREDEARRWLEAYQARCRAIAIHDSHHPRFRLGPIIAGLAAAGDWRVFEYRGNAAGWTVLARPGEPCPEEGDQGGQALSLMSG